MKHVKSNDIYECVRGLAAGGEIRMFPRLGGLLKCYRRVLPGTPGGVPVDAPPPPARASA